MTIDELMAQRSQNQQAASAPTSMTVDQLFSQKKDPIQESINDVHTDIENHAKSPVTTFFEGLKAKAGKLAEGYAGGGVGGALAYAFPEQYMHTVRDTVPEAGMSLVKGTAKTAIQFPQTAVGSAAQLPGDIMSYVGQKPVEPTAANAFGKSVMQPINVPSLGQVKALSAAPGDVQEAQAQTPGETLKQAGNIYLEGGMPGASKAFGAGLEAVGLGKGTFSKWANRISTIPEDAVRAAQNPETAKEIQALRAGTAAAQQVPVKPGSVEEIKSIGEKAFQTAKEQNTAAGKAYEATRNALISANEGKIISRSKDFVTGTKDALSAEGIAVKGKKVSLVGSQFEGSPSAQGHLQRVYDLMSRPAVKGKSVTEDLLARREALSSVMSDIPPEQANLRRVVGNMRTAFDDTLDRIIGEQASSAREAYSSTKSATQPIIKSMTKLENGKRVFSEDKAFSFVDKALKDSKFDNSNMLSELDKVAGTSHASDLEKIANARSAYEEAISRGEERVSALKALNAKLSETTPELQSSLLSIARRYATKIPVLKDTATFMLTPKFWGDIAISRGLKAGEKTVGMSPEAKKAAMWLLTNMIAAPTK